MRASEFIVEGFMGDVWNALKSNPGGGMGGYNASPEATRNQFVKDFIATYNQVTKSGQNAGIAGDTQQYLTNYFRKYGWYATPAQIKQLADLGDINKIADGVYHIGMNQARHPTTGQVLKKQPGVAGNTSVPAQTAKSTATPAATTAPQAGANAMNQMVGQLTTPTVTQATPAAPQSPEAIRKQKQAAATQVARQQMSPPPRTYHPAASNKNINLGYNE